MTTTRSVFRSAGAEGLVKPKNQPREILLSEVPVAQVVNDETAQDTRQAA